MDVISNFFEAIASNFFIIALIIGGLISFLKDNGSKEKKQEKNPYNKPKNPSGPLKNPNQNAQPTQAGAEKDTLKEQQRKSLEAITDREKIYSTLAQSENHIHDAIRSSTLRKPEDVELSYNQKKFKKQVRANLGKNGLVNGIIMSEILGPPRAIKPYKSVIQQRRK